ncbi:DUF2188 domain-containing protein [Flaviflagellibacter deserti]|uniref:DUF2188 domain-containing protein n=1 Tax=Flaviflagellibacter deserti TaxID=2267266 RepID=A0ABV9YZ51_9HYPH
MIDQTVHLIRQGSHWLMRIEGKATRHFATRDAALRAAVMLADQGQSIEVRVQSPDGGPLLTFRAVPTFTSGGSIH